MIHLFYSLLFPSLPNFRAETYGCGFAIANHGGLHKTGVIKDLVLFGSFIAHIAHIGDLLRFAIPVNKIVDAAHCPEDTVKLLAGHAVLHQIDELVLDTPFLEPALRFLGI